MRTRFVWTVILLTVVMVALLPDLAPAAKPGGTLKLALLRDPVGWEPHINQGATTYTFLNNIYEPQKCAIRSISSPV